MRRALYSLMLVCALTTSALGGGFMLGGATARPHALLDTKAQTVLGTYADQQACKTAMLTQIRAAYPSPAPLNAFYRFICEPTR